MGRPKSKMETPPYARIGVITYSHNARPTGNVTGIDVVIIGGLYPYDNYYGYGYYPYSYGYDPGYYDSYGYQDEEYYGANSDDVTVRSADSIVANAQEELAQQGYYRGEIDGILGPEMSRAIARFQSNQGLRVTGVLTRDTVNALGLRQVAVY